VFYAGYSALVASRWLALHSLTVAKGIRPLLKWLRPVEGALATTV
jgi:hypothetical protein